MIDKISGRINGEVIRDGDLVIAQGSIINGNVFVKGKLTIENYVHVYGNVVATEEVVFGNRNDIRGLVMSQLGSVTLGDENFTDCISGFEVTLGKTNVIRNWISSPGGVKEIGTLPSVWGMLFD